MISHFLSSRHAQRCLVQARQRKSNVCSLFFDSDHRSSHIPGDLERILASLGQHPSPQEITEMLEGNTNLNFTAFLSMFGNQMTSTDQEDVIRKAFQSLDEDAEGKIDARYFKDLLTGVENR